jgi:phosphinothricin acetyltransferase
MSVALERLRQGSDPIEKFQEFLDSASVRAAMAPLPFRVRSVEGEADLSAMCAIYAPFVQSETCTWAVAPEELPRVSEWVEKWAKASKRGLPWLVAVNVNTGDVVGYCCVDDFRGRRGWQKTCEHGIYIAPGWQRKGVGKALLAACSQRSRAAGVACLMAVISVDPQTGAGAASCALHASMGFEKTGFLKGVGFKLGKVLDCQFMSKYLVPLKPE